MLGEQDTFILVSHCNTYMTQIAVRLDDGMVNSIEDELDNDPRFENRSQFIRYGIRVALKSEYEQSE